MPKVSWAVLRLRHRKNSALLHILSGAPGHGMYKTTRTISTGRKCVENDVSRVSVTSPLYSNSKEVNRVSTMSATVASARSDAP